MSLNTPVSPHSHDERGNSRLAEPCDHPRTTLAPGNPRQHFMRRTRMTRRRLAVLLAVVGPGLITSNVDNDAGGITTYTTSGAQFGYTLLWSLIPMTIALYVSEEMCARMGVVTGKGLSDLIREEFGFRSTFFVMIAALAVDLGNTVAEFAGVAASMEIFGISKYISVPLAAIAVWLLVVKGSYRQVEKIFLVACGFYLTYVVLGVPGEARLAASRERNRKAHASISAPAIC